MLVRGQNVSTWVSGYFFMSFSRSSSLESDIFGTRTRERNLLAFPRPSSPWIWLASGLFTTTSDFPTGISSIPRNSQARRAFLYVISAPTFQPVVVIARTLIVHFLWSQSAQRSAKKSSAPGSQSMITWGILVFMPLECHILRLFATLLDLFEAFCSVWQNSHKILYCTHKNRVLCKIFS